VTSVALVPMVTGPAVAFWLLAPVMVLAAIGMILSRKPVHSALCLATVMISLAVQYAAQNAPFLFAVQIIVYTGAILMLFLFVLMLVGVDAADSLVETIKGQRPLAALAGLGFGALLVFAVGNALVGAPLGLGEANSANGGNVQGIAALVFNRYVFAFEATSALLITAAVGAMVLAHRERLTAKETQGDLARLRMRRYADSGVAEASISGTLRARGTVLDSHDLVKPTDANVRAVTADGDNQRIVSNSSSASVGTDHDLEVGGS
jgi:NADH-quinone oxidoreductase subunit J